MAFSSVVCDKNRVTVNCGMAFLKFRCLFNNKATYAHKGRGMACNVMGGAGGSMNGRLGEL